MDGKKPILCLDFDGVLHSYVSGWKGPEIIPDLPNPGAFGFIRAALREFEVHVFSSRSSWNSGIEAMRAWFAKHGGGDFVFLLEFPLQKPPAFVTLDDRAIQFKGEWPDLVELKKFRPWNLRDVGTS